MLAYVKRELAPEHVLRQSPVQFFAGSDGLLPGTIPDPVDAAQRCIRTFYLDGRYRVLKAANRKLLQCSAYPRGG